MRSSSATSPRVCAAISRCRAKRSKSRKRLTRCASARARFFPELSLQARYTRAEGGREFELPLGTALNPVYSTLNELLAAQGQPAPFPQIHDETIQFLREEEQDTRLIARQPLYAPAIPAAVRAQRALARREQLQPHGDRARSAPRHHDRLSRLAEGAQLGRDRRGERGAAAREPARQRIAVRQRQDHRRPGAARKAELLEVEQQKREVENLTTQARSYFNFLLNRDLTGRIEPTSPPATHAERDAALEQLWASALDRRPEVRQVEQLRARQRRTGPHRAQAELADAVARVSMPARRARNIVSAMATTSAPPR